MKKILLVCLATFNLLFAERIELNLGETKDYAERDILELIRERLVNNKDEIDKKIKEAQKEAKNKVMKYQPKGLEPLKPATKERIFYPPTDYTVKEDIVDANGNVLYKKGFTFNVGDYVKIHYAMVVIDATNKDEVEWLKQTGYLNSIAYRILLSDGNYYDMMQELGQEIFYLMPQIRERFQIQKTPSIIKQVENKIEVKEICVPCLKEQNATKRELK